MNAVQFYQALRHALKIMKIPHGKVDTVKIEVFPGNVVLRTTQGNYQEVAIAVTDPTPKSGPEIRHFGAPENSENKIS